MMMTLRERYDCWAGELASLVSDRLYLGELLNETPAHPVYFAALRHLLRLPTWRLWLASKALGERPIDDYLEGEGD